MIQRIQSIYLFLAAAAMGSSFFLPLATASGDASALAATGDNYFADGVYWSFILVAMLAALGYYYAERLPEGSAAHLAAGSIVEPLAIPFLILAYRAIKKDEKLVRSSDRLR